MQPLSDRNGSLLRDEHPRNILQAALAATRGTWRCLRAALGSRQLPTILQALHRVRVPREGKVPVVAAEGPAGTGSSGLSLQPSGWAKERGVLGREVL